MITLSEITDSFSIITGSKVNRGDRTIISITGISRFFDVVTALPINAMLSIFSIFSSVAAVHPLILIVSSVSPVVVPEIFLKSFTGTVSSNTTGPLSVLFISGKHIWFTTSPIKQTVLSDALCAVNARETVINAIYICYG